MHKFKVGDKVRYRAEGGEPWSGLTVRRIIGDSALDYIEYQGRGAFGRRILATRDDGGGSIEAAERYFELEDC